MKQIFGYVLVKETNVGIPNLVVAAYDSEKSMQEIVASRRAKKDFSPDDLGRRISSVLTDQSGKFTLNRNELEFQGNESRLDLLIVVFAPDDVQNIDEPFPLPSEQRILYVSTVRRQDAGAEEAFVIRLLQAQLDHFHIPISATMQGSEGDVQSYVDSVQKTVQFRDTLRKKLQPSLQKEQKKAEKIQQLAQGKVKNLSAIPQYLREGKIRNNQFLINGKQDLASNLVAKQDEAIANGLKRFQTRQPVMRLTLTKNDLEDLGLREVEGKIAGEVDPKKLFEKTRALTKGVDLVKVRGLNNPSPEELERKYLIEVPPPLEKNIDHRKK